MKCPNARLLPFQIRGTSGSPGTLAWKLVNAVSEANGVTEEIGLDSALLIPETLADDKGWYVTFFSISDISPVPDCGFYYIVVTVGGVPYYSEVLHLDGVSSEEVVSLTLDACDTTSTGTIFGLNAADTLSGTIAAQEIGGFVGGAWQVLGDNDANILWNESGPIEVYRRVTLTTGRVITAYGEITFSDPTDPCADAALSMSSITSTGPDELWRVRFYFTADKGTVLYQTGFQQWFYLKERPTFVLSTFESDEDAQTDGYGVEKTVVAVLTERLGFDYFPVADHMAQGIIECCYACTEAYLEETISAAAYQLVQPRASFAASTTGLNTITITSITAQTVLACSDNFTLE